MFLGNINDIILVGDNMTNKEIILVFEKETVPLIINQLNNMQVPNLVLQISKNTQLILNTNNLVINENFPFSIHLEILKNYFFNYIRDDYYNDDSSFIKIIFEDFCLYWKNIKSPQLII